MMRRVTVPVLVSAALTAPVRCSSSSTPQDYSGRVAGATGVDNRPGVYGTKSEEAFFEKAYPNKVAKEVPSHDRSFGPNEPKDRSDNIKVPEFDTVFGKYETAPYFSGGPAGHRYQKYVREPADKEVVQMKDVIPQGAIVDHHPHFNYTSVTGKKDGNISNHLNTWANWDLRAAKMSLYRSCLKSIPLAKHFYYLSNPIDRLKSQIRLRFLQNRNVKDPDAIRHLIHSGWMEYQETVLMRRTRTSLQKFFSEDANTEVNLEIYAEDEGKNIAERRFWNGEEQRKEGPYDGFWSQSGKELDEEFERLAGRVPISWTASKGYFEKFRPDGTNFWEKNLDYEGWYLKNVDPDRKSARKEMQSWTESGYNQPKHYASKNRRGYRRLVKDIESVMQSSLEDIYVKNREQTFQYLIRENHAESNRISAERRLARMDDEFFTTKFDEYEKHMKQVMREMPNPRLWKTDAFYFRLRYLVSALDFNWARVPVGTAQEKLYGEWISDNANYAVITSTTFEAIKANKQQNAMANTFADFYAAFDPDVPETRRLPWYHPEFDYDRRHKWDERCMRMKKWVQSGGVDGKNDYFASYVAEWEQYVNRPERFRAMDQQDRRYSAPRMVQLYRALGKLMDVALANQIKETAAVKLNKSVAELSAMPVDAIQKALSTVSFNDFTFRVPTIIYPDGYIQPQLGLDGTPIGPIPEQPRKEEAALNEAASATSSSEAATEATA